MRGALWVLGLIALPTVATPGGPKVAPPVTFADHVLPLLQRQGCASAYCHGSATGRGGFKLSLFGSDPDADWRALATDLGGRRLDLRDPDRSLLLQKGSGRVPHGGGTRLPRDAAAYALLRDWIAGGALRGAVEPAANGLAVELVGERLRATATMPNGQADVSALAVFGSSEETVVAVAADGRITVHGAGETFVTARYGGRDAVLRIVRRAADAPNAPPAEGHTADRAWLGWLGELGLSPAPRAAPHRLVRRLHLDLAGRPPAPHEVRAFVDLPATVAVAVTADRLLATSAFTDEFARHLAEMFEVAGEAAPMQAERQAALRERLHTAVAAGLPLDRLVRELLASGAPLLERFGDPRDRAEFVGRAFFGMQIGCARCHDHPNDRWRQRDHQGFSALLATRRGTGGELLAGAVFDEGTGDACPPVMLPIAPAVPAAPADLEQRHAALRDAVLTGSDVFARNFCNRLLGWLLGRAPVEPVDDHRLANPARCAPLLEAAVAEYRRTNGDLRALVRWVVTSALWAVDSEPVGENDELAARYFARQQARPLSADRLARASAYVLDVSATALPVDPLARELNRRHGEWLGAAVRSPGGAIDLIAATANGDAALAELFLQILGRPPRADEIAELRPRLSTPPLRDRLIELAHALLLTREFASRR